MLQIGLGFKISKTIIYSKNLPDFTKFSGLLISHLNTSRKIQRETAHKINEADKNLLSKAHKSYLVVLHNAYVKKV